MKLFMIILLHGKIGGVVGPLPYDLEECERRAAEFQEEQNPVSPLIFKCVESKTRPEIEIEE